MADDDQKARDTADRETAMLWRAWRTAHEMVNDRVCYALGGHASRHAETAGSEWKC